MMTGVRWRMETRGVRDVMVQTGRAATLAEFLLAAIADDEAMASVAGEAAERGITLPPENKAAVIVLSEPEVMEFHATFDPARILAECEAKRRIVDEHAEHVDGGRCRTCHDHDDVMVHQAYPCTTLLELVQPYYDYPGFRDEWRL